MQPLFDEHGTLRPLHELPSAVTAAVRILKARETRDGSGRMRRRSLLIAMHDKARALGLLMKYLTPAAPAENSLLGQVDQETLDNLNDEELRRLIEILAELRGLVTVAGTRREEIRARRRANRGRNNLPGRGRVAFPVPGAVTVTRMTELERQSGRRNAVDHVLLRHAGGTFATRGNA